MKARKPTANATSLPPLPKPDKHGCYPAIEYMRASIARSFIQGRVAVRLTRQRLAELAGVRETTIARLESGKDTVSVRTVEKIDRAIEAERKRLARQKSKVTAVTFGMGRFSKDETTKGETTWEPST